MTSRIITALAFSLSLGTAAIAQTATMDADTRVGASAGMPAGWDGEIGNAFFQDESLGTLRSESEVRANFDDLSIEQQAMVRGHCALVDTAEADFGTDLESDVEVTQDLDLDEDFADETADLDVDSEIETGALDSETETSLDDEIQTGAAAPGTTPDLDDEVDTGAAAPGTTPELDGEFETGAAADLEDEFETGAAGIDTEIETGATTPGAEFETEAELTQDMDPVPGDGTMDAQIQVSIEQLCAWIDE